MKVRRVYLRLAAVGLLFWSLDAVQRWAYEHRLPEVAERVVRGEGELTRVVMVAGQGLDGAETATSIRDLAAASDRIFAVVPGRVDVVSLLPGGNGYGTSKALELIATSSCEHLIIYLTGHGGGRNFGAVGGLNLTRDGLVSALSSARFKKATVVLDCCWSGEFARSFEDVAFVGSVTLVTSTDAHHPSPYPISFLSPHSYGHTFFKNWQGDADTAFESTNASRRRIQWLFSKEFGLEGELRRF